MEKKKTVLKLIFGYSLSGWVGALIGFLIVPISSRIYTQDQLGKITFFFSVINLLYTFLCLALDQGYLRFYSEVRSKDKRRKLFTFSICVVFALCAALAIICYPFSSLISSWLFGESLDYIVIYIFIMITNILLLRFISLPYRMTNNILKYSYYSILLIVFTKAIFIVAAFISLDYITAIITSSVISLACFMIVGFCNRQLFAKIKIKEDKVLYKNELLYSFPLIPAMLMSLLNNNIPQFFLRSIQGFSSVAIFSSAVTIASVVNIVQSGFSTFWRPYVFSNYKTKQKRIQKIHELVVLIMIVFSLIIVISQDAIFLLLGENYRKASQYLPFLMLSPLCYTIGETTNIGVDIRKKTYMNVVIHIVAVIVNVVLCFYLVPYYAEIGAAVSAGCAAIVSLGIKTIIGNKLYKSVRNFRLLSIALFIYVFAAIINLYLYNNVWKYFLLIMIAIIAFIVLNGLKYLKLFYKK